MLATLSYIYVVAQEKENINEFDLIPWLLVVEIVFSLLIKQSNKFEANIKKNMMTKDLEGLHMATEFVRKNVPYK